MNTLQGHIDHWNDGKGFGFITPDGDGERLFFHISEVRGGRPQMGARVSFSTSRDNQGRPRAQQVKLLNQQSSTRVPARSKAIKTSRTPQWLALGLVIVALILWQLLSGVSQQAQHRSAQYNPQLEHTLSLIRQGGPYPYRQDNTVFQNRERLLPQKPRGYYREYTVETPGLSHRGARRVVTGGQPPEVWYYTQDHYRSFILLEPKP